MQAVFLTSGGAEANESAFKTARFYWKARGQPDKVKIIARDQAYHGLTLQTMSATGMGVGYWKMFEPRVPGFVHIQTCYPYRYQGAKPGESVGQAAARELEEAILREGPDTVAAFVGEPIHGAGGVFYPTDDYWPRVREVCTRHDVLLIADEIITGFCRTGRWFGLSHWNVTPDILSFAKGVTSGYLPLGGIMVTTRDQGGDGLGHARGPLDARLHVLRPSDLLRGRAEEHRDHAARAALARTRRRWVSACRPVSRRRSAITRTRATSGAARGCSRPWSSWRTGRPGRTSPSDLKVAARLKAEMMKRGVITRTRPAVGAHPAPGDILFFAPPLVITEAEIDRLVSVARDAVEVVLARWVVDRPLSHRREDRLPGDHAV